MPLYAYRCLSCEQPFEKIRRFADMDQPAECPSCGTETGLRELAAPAPSPGTRGGGASVSGGGGCSPRGGFT